ncbi:MAG TPA: preprotein translocase subunit YajC [Acidobacteriota bacterium]|nr:preprotein translocase subunit YajC [Acidobacteriota bacterium]
MLSRLVLAQTIPGAQSPLIAFLPIVLIAAVFYLLVFRPMKTRQKKVDQMIANLKSGDRVITSGGIYGTIAAVKDKTFLLRVSDQVKIEVAKSSIAGLQSEEIPTA